MLIENWRAAPKMASVWTAALGAIATLWLALSPEVQAAVLAKLGVSGLLVTVGVSFLGTIAARLVRQESVSGPATPPLPVIDPAWSQQ